MRGGVERVRKLIPLDIAALPRLMSGSFYVVWRCCGLQQIYGAFSYNVSVATYVPCIYTEVDLF